MQAERVVANASPLIVLFKSQLADLLPQLFVEVLVPGAVWNEVIAGGATDSAAQQLPTASWAKRIEVPTIDPLIAAWNLGAGESEVLSSVLGRPGHRAMIDDRAARSCARTLNITTLGTGGALVLAKRRGLIPSVTAALRLIQDAGLWLSADVELLLKRQAGE